jgi:hypothetical protein
MMEALYFSETSIITKATLRYIQEDNILRSHGRENLKSYKFQYWFLSCDQALI